MKELAAIWAVWQHAMFQKIVMPAVGIIIALSLLIATWFQYQMAVDGDGKFVIFALFVGVSVIICGIFAYPLIWRTPGSASPRNLRNYANALVSIIIWFAVMTGGFTIFPIAKHPELVWVIFLTGIIISLAYRWGFEPSWARPAIYWSCVVLMLGVIGIYASSMLSPAIFGTDLVPSKADQALVTERLAQEEELKGKALQIMRKDPSKRTAAEKELLEKVGDTSLVGNIKKLFPSEAKASVPTQKTAQTEPAVETKTVATTPAVPAQIIVQEVIREVPVAVSAPAPTATEVWNMRFRKNGQLLEENFELVHADNNIVLSAKDNTKMTLKMVSGNHYAGTILIDGVHPGACEIKLNGWDGTGWWAESTPTNFTLRRLS